MRQIPYSFKKDHVTFSYYTNIVFRSVFIQFYVFSSMAFMKTYTFQLFQSQRGLSFITRLDAGTSAFSSNNRTASLLESILWTRKSDFSRFLLSASPRLYPRHGNCIKKHHRSDPSRPDSATRPLQCVTAAIPPLLQVTSTEEMNGLYVIVGATGAIGRCLSKKVRRKELHVSSRCLS